MTAEALLSSSYEQLSVGLSFTTRGRTITEADIVNFAGFSGDWNQLHVDAEWRPGRDSASGSPTGRPC
jgi:acyl dehydratase